MINKITSQLSVQQIVYPLIDQQAKFQLRIGSEVLISKTISDRQENFSD